MPCSASTPHHHDPVPTALALTDFPCIVTGSTGAASIDEEAFKQMLTSSSYKVRSVTFDDDVKIRLLNDDTAVVAYRIHEELEVNGKTVTVDAADASTWVRRDGKWACAQHSESLLEVGGKRIQDESRKNDSGKGRDSEQEKG